MLITLSFKKSLIVEQFQGNYLNIMLLLFLHKYTLYFCFFNGTNRKMLITMSCLIVCQAEEQLEHEQLIEKIQDLEGSTARVSIGGTVVLVTNFVLSCVTYSPGIV